MFAASYSLGNCLRIQFEYTWSVFFVRRVLFFLVRQSNWKLIPNRCEVAMRRRSTLRSNPDSVNLKSIWIVPLTPTYIQLLCSIESSDHGDVSDQF